MDRLLLLAFICFELSASANMPFPGVFQIRNHGAETFSVVIDRQQVATRIHSFQYNGLSDGSHRVKIQYDCFDISFDRHNDVIFDDRIEFHSGRSLIMDILPNSSVRISAIHFACAGSVAGTAGNLYFGNGNSRPGHLPIGMDSDAFLSLKKSVEDRSFDSSKQDLIINTLHRSRISSAQLLELIELLDFESSKVQIAKSAYTSVVDKENFHMIYNGFSFDSSVREIQRFVG